MMTNKPHVHAEVIKAWADGKQIQFKNELTNGWIDLAILHPSWLLTSEYRVKPETIRYRAALLTCGTLGHRTASANTESGVRAFEAANTFVRWLTDWIEVEV